MNMSSSELKERYSKLSDDELISLYMYSDLRPDAKEYLNLEMRNREISESDINEAVKFDKNVQKLEQEKLEKARKSSRIEFLFYTVFFLIVIIGVIIKSILE